MRTCEQGDGGDPCFRRQGNLDQVAGTCVDDNLITLTIVIITIVFITIVIVITFIAIDQIINAHQEADALWKIVRCNAL